MSPPRPIRSEDSDAVPQLQQKIAEAEKLHAMMRAANRIVRDRKLADQEKVGRLVAECDLDAGRARRLLKPDFAGRIGFPNYELTNNGANIRRMQARVNALTKESARSSVVVEFPGGRMEDSAEACRVRIYHDAKPGAEVIQQLKANGFHWTPTIMAWQRMRNDSARGAATRVTGAQWPEAPAADATNATSEAPTVAVAPASPATGPKMTA